jgi:tetratricopeptide (TPR) repeat protein
MTKLIIFIGFLLYSLTGIVKNTFAQVDDYERGQQLKYLDIGIRQYENGDYEAADQSFRQVLEEVKVLPAEICYYFGVNSFHLQKYKQSINWLNKYIELKGTSGQFFEESTTYLELSQQRYLLANNTQKEDSFEPEQMVDYTVMPEVDCGPSGKVMCPVCKGQTVIISRSAMSLTYRTCQYCDKHGNLSCENYNLLIQGKLKPNSERSAQ